MKALLCTKPGTPDDLELADLPDPIPGPGEAVVRGSAVGLNFFDTLIIAGKYQYKPALPFSPGAEFAGTVESVGAHASVWRSRRTVAWCSQPASISTGQRVSSSPTAPRTTR